MFRKENDGLSWNNLSKRMALLIPAVFVPIWSALFRHMTIALMFSPLGEAFLNTSARASNHSSVHFHPKRHVRPVALELGLLFVSKDLKKEKL